MAAQHSLTQAEYNLNALLHHGEWGWDLEALSVEYTIITAACTYTLCLYTYFSPTWYLW